MKQNQITDSDIIPLPKDKWQDTIIPMRYTTEEWSNRLVVTELWVDESIRRQGVAHKLMAIAKRQAVTEHRRALILETQSCNTGAISFYRSEGVELIGFDSCCYSNRDVQKKEVRINLGYYISRGKPEP